jgi:hypothetical protein
MERDGRRENGKWGTNGLKEKEGKKQRSKEAQKQSN